VPPSMRRVSLAVVLGAVGAIVSYWLIRPELHLSRKRLYVFVGESCGKSMSILAQLERDPALRDVVVPLHAGDGTDKTDARICRLLAPDIRKNAPWFALLGVDDAWICDRVGGWSRAVHREVFVYLPAWTQGRAPIHWKKRARALATHGIVWKDDHARPLRWIDEDASEDRAEDPLKTSEAKPEPDDAESGHERPETSHRQTDLQAWRGYDIGF
jgi:hypothetical protein